MGGIIVAVGTALVAFALYSVVAYAASPLRKFPGPFLAGWTNLYTFFVVRTGSYHVKVKKLHEKYGPVVRLGPNKLDLDYPELIKTLYSADTKWLKTSFYHNNSTLINGQIIFNLFSLPDPVEHQRMKRPIAKHYSSSAVLTVEPLVDRVLEKLCDHLESRFVKGATGPKQCDLGAWIAYCTWDMVGAATFSESFGYMDKGCDHDGTIEIADKALDYFAAIGQMPFMDFWLDKNPVYRVGPPNLGNITRIALEHIGARAQGKDPNYDPKTPDYLQSFLDAKAANPEVVHDGMVLNYVFINLIAGADTTALTIRAVVYHVLKNPDVHRKLEQEILGAKLGKVAQYGQAKNLPYLEAVIRETMRVHPGVAMALDRYVPADGLRLPDGRYVPAQTSVGINPYVVNRNTGVFGADADTFRPERWLQGSEESDDAFRERLKLFNNTDLSFGNGSRICLGRHIALLETYKFVATLIGRYEIELAEPDKEWEVTCSWFLRQRGLICNLKERV